MFKKVYHIDDQETPIEMYELDANTAVRQHPLEWSYVAWTDEAAEKAKRAMEKKRAAEAAKNNPAPAPLAPPAKKYEAKHRGGGSYSVIGADGSEILDKLSKDDSLLFNESSEEAQEAYITAEKATRAGS